MLFQQNPIFTCCPGFTEADLLIIETEREDLSFENNLFKDIQYKKIAGCNLRVSKNGRLGSATSTNLRDLGALAKLADSIAEYGDFGELHLPYNCEYPVLGLDHQGVFELSAEQIITDCQEIIDLLMQEYGDKVLVDLAFSRKRLLKEYYNSHEIAASARKEQMLLRIAAFLDTGSRYIYTQAARIGLKYLIDSEQIVQELTRGLQRKEVSVQIPPGKWAVIFAPQALAQILHNLEWFKADQLLLGASPLAKYLGQQIFDQRLTLIDDGTLIGGSESWPFDDEGTPMERTVLVESGVLTNVLHTRKTAHDMKMSPTGNGLRIDYADNNNYDQVIQPGFTNVVLEPGETSLAEMTSGERVILVEEIFDLAKDNTQSENFVCGISQGYLLKNGQYSGQIEGVRLSANLLDLLRNRVVAVENIVHHTPIQYQFGSYYLPHIFFEDLKID